MKIKQIVYVKKSKTIYFDIKIRKVSLFISTKLWHLFFLFKIGSIIRIHIEIGKNDIT